MGLERADDFTDITSDTDLANRLAGIYGDVDLVDAWIGGLAEDCGHGLLGETFALIVTDQFERLRDGDAYWSQAGGLNRHEVAEIWETGLADIIERNTDVGTIQDDIFFAFERLGGDAGKNKLLGEDERDLLLGFAGNDHLDGNARDDQLDGGDGRDRLDGGKGDKVLEGGRRNDVFAFSLKANQNRIVDFEKGDRVQIDADGRNLDLHKALRQEGDDVVLRLSKQASVLFKDLNESDLDSSAFLFV